MLTYPKATYVLQVDDMLLSFHFKFVKDKEI